ncbi:hypothetical protein AA0473_0085 [Acetobacter orleanensis NRIC 0473]|uniref:Uncharacterized protein n=1 Tax=Acetobacter orleanensis TaxID=104099 RepID=A0A4Y3TL20_9PROT|nr:hypothetical protein Abol_010_004 [Acetobacter orleanensis JCM 7639]GBR22292.1 hypothetical protein AA0473_0085 [Acetobacter orleanensis NRIC 0473]GEB83026.1 hypothetical protein AOR01nite_15030 [Acetobacter orleanensis]
MGNRQTHRVAEQGNHGKPVSQTAHNARTRASPEHFQPEPILYPPGSRGGISRNGQSTHPNQQTCCCVLVAFEGLPGGKIAVTFWV